MGGGGGGGIVSPMEGFKYTNIVAAEEIPKNLHNKHTLCIHGDLSPNKSIPLSCKVMVTRGGRGAHLLSV